MKVAPAGAGCTQPLQKALGSVLWQLPDSQEKPPGLSGCEDRFSSCGQAGGKCYRSVVSWQCLLRRGCLVSSSYSPSPLRTRCSQSGSTRRLQKPLQRNDLDLNTFENIQVKMRRQVHSGRRSRISPPQPLKLILKPCLLQICLSICMLSICPAASEKCVSRTGKTDLSGCVLSSQNKT